MLAPQVCADRYIDCISTAFVDAMMPDGPRLHAVISMPREMHTLAMELERTRGVSFGRQARAVDPRQRSGVDRWDIWSQL